MHLTYSAHILLHTNIYKGLELCVSPLLIGTFNTYINFKLHSYRDNGFEIKFESDKRNQAECD